MRRRAGVVELAADDRIRRFVEKPRPGEIRSPWVNSGVMVLDRALLARIPAGRFSDFGREVLPEWLAAGIPLYGWPLPAGTFLVDVGSPESYARAEREWRARGGHAVRASTPRSAEAGRSSAAAISAWSGRPGGHRRARLSSTTSTDARQEPG